MDNFKELTEVFSDHPDLKNGFEEFFESYVRPHHLMKAKRWLTSEEIEELRKDCTNLGVIFPKVFKRSIPSKMDDLIFIVPLFAEKFNTLGGLREEDIERLHNEMNQILRVLCSVRDSALKLTLAMERVELKRATPINPAEPVKRKFRCKVCSSKPYLKDDTCPECSYTRKR